MKSIKSAVPLLLVASLVATLASNVSAQTARRDLARESAVETIKKRGELVVGLSTFIPWAMRDKTGEIIGF
ncbi:MAG: transporter substrate-binding domain-containing protein, partial [Gammaproteobacteria bacterium]